MSAHLKNPFVWLHGLGAAIITGAASALTASAVAPETFNFGSGLKKLAILAAVNGITGAAAYLKNSPLPPIEES